MKLLRKIDFLTDKKTGTRLNIGAVLLIVPFLLFFAWIALELLDEDDGIFSFIDKCPPLKNIKQINKLQNDENLVTCELQRERNKNDDFLFQKLVRCIG